MQSFFGRLFSRAGNSHTAQPKVQRPSSPPRSLQPTSASGTSDTSVWPVGKVVGYMYEICGLLGQGGMGLVYRAHDHGTHRDIAVKVPLGGNTTALGGGGWCVLWIARRRRRIW